MSTRPVTGFVGLGSMGSVLAANLVGAGHDVVAYDVAGPDPGARRARRGSTGPPSWPVAPTSSC